MRIADHPKCDALCGEYMLGTLRGAARRRFERALREEPRVAARLAHWQREFAPRYTTMMNVQPPARVWRAIARDLDLGRHAAPWHGRLGLWRGWAIGATAALALVLAIGLGLRLTPEAPAFGVVAELSGKSDAARVTAALSRDGRTLELRAVRAVAAGPLQSYELWLLPAEGGAPVSLAVLGALDGRFRLPDAQVGRLRAGAKLAVSVEPAGGSPTGAPTGPVILIGAIVA